MGLRPDGTRCPLAQADLDKSSSGQPRPQRARLASATCALQPLRFTPHSGYLEEPL
jgi:hypothetical protein